MKEFPSSCNNAFQATVRGGFNIWHWLKVQEVSMSGINKRQYKPLTFFLYDNLCKVGRTLLSIFMQMDCQI